VNALALPLALIVQEYNVIPTAGRANHDAIRPAEQNHVGQSVVWIGIKYDCVLQGLWVLVFAVHDQNYRLFHLICQVYYCP
jgi:hypothetical protein